MQIAIVSGEASGDRAGGQLAGEIFRLRPDAAVWGTGGKYLRAAGAEVVIDSSRWGVVGVASGVRLLPRILRGRARLQREMLRRRPDVLVAIDAGAFHQGFMGLEGLCPWTRRVLPQTRILYYFPPGSWRQTLRATRLARFTDAVATPFPWSETELKRLGVNATFVGHPLLDLVKPSLLPAEFARQYHLDPDRPVVGILPGSRQQEIAAILPTQLEAAAIIHGRVPGVQFLLALAPTVDRADVMRVVESLRRRNAVLREALHRMEERLRDEMTGKRLPALVTTGGTLAPRPPSRPQWEAVAAQRPRDFALTIAEDATYDVMAASDVLMATSGTATLEAAILGRPMVIMYRMARANIVEYQFVKKTLPPFIGMPNLIAGRMIAPEFIQDAATPAAIAGAIITLLLEPARMLQMREDLQQVVAQLGHPGGATRAAEMVIALATANPAGEPASSTIRR